MSEHREKSGHSSFTRGCSHLTGKLLHRHTEDEELSLRAKRSNLRVGMSCYRDCFVAPLLAMTLQTHCGGLLLFMVNCFRMNQHLKLAA